MRAGSFAALLLFVTLLNVSPARAQFHCQEIRNDWLSSGVSAPLERGEAISLFDYVHVVPPEHTANANSKLVAREIVELSDAQAGALLGKALSVPAGRKAYLVRSVFAIENPAIQVNWVGSSLLVATGGMGCGTFQKQALVIYLDRRPERVIVEAGTDL